MKTVLFVIAAASASHAHASPTCTDYEKVVAAASDGFKSLRARAVADGAYFSSFQITGAGPCMIAETPDEAIFACRRPFSSGVESDEAYKADSAYAMTCLPNWQAKPASLISKEQFTAVKGVRIVGPAGINVDVVHFQETRGLLKLDWVSVSVSWHAPPSVS